MNLIKKATEKHNTFYMLAGMVCAAAEENERRTYELREFVENAAPSVKKLVVRKRTPFEGAKLICDWLEYGVNNDLFNSAETAINFNTGVYNLLHHYQRSGLLEENDYLHCAFMADMYSNKILEKGGDIAAEIREINPEFCF